MLSSKPVFSKIERAVIRTLKNKYKSQTVLSLKELKGHEASLSVKKYFYHQINTIENWAVYSIVADKQKWLGRYDLADKSEFYDLMLLTLLQNIPLHSSSHSTHLVLDQSKNKYMKEKLTRRLAVIAGENQKPLIIAHLQSHHEKLLQAADVFCSGIAKKYEHNNLDWYHCYQNKIAFEKLV